MRKLKIGQIKTNDPRSQGDKVEEVGFELRSGSLLYQDPSLLHYPSSGAKCWGHAVPLGGGGVPFIGCMFLQWDAG